MDKETLSNYGWIVIVILVLSILLALATPFGQYISNAIKLTTQGLFDTGKESLSIVDIMLGNNRFPTGEEPQVDGEWLVIKSDSDLAWVLENQDTLGASKIRFDDDIDMKNNTFAPLPNTIIEVNGNGKTVSNLQIEGTGLFGDVNSFEIYDFAVNNITVTADGHVGVLVGTSKGTANFTNCSVINSSATTTNGAGGGILGYAVRKSEKDRSESMNVSFSSCAVSDTTVSASMSEGKMVGLFSGYDNGETLSFNNCSANTTVADYSSRYTNANQSAFLSVTNSSYDGLLGDETFKRGIVQYNSNRIVPKWDGVTTVEPLLANTTYDGVTAGTNKFVVYSPFDLAGIRKKTASPAAIYLKSDVDMNGQGADGKYNVPSNFTQSAFSSTDDNVFNPFEYVTTLDGMNHSIYNLSIAQIEQERAAFILYAAGTTVHKNINFRNCQTVATHKPVVTDAKAYAAILVSNVDATYTMENVHAYDCKTFGLNKVGTLGARISGTSTLKNNTVNNCYVENYECMISERFTSGKKQMQGFTVEVYADFYPHGEVGGMFGFIQGNSTITNCKVNNTTIYAFGQDDKTATIDGNTIARLGLANLGYYKVPGRHVSTFIGNIRATGTVTLTGCSVDANTKCANRRDKHNSIHNMIGQAYIIKFVDSEGSVTVDGSKLTLADCNKNTRL